MALLIYFIAGTVCLSFLLCLGQEWAHQAIHWLRRSACDYCGHSLGPLDLIPIGSYCCRRGRCRYCHRRLSLYYCLSEMAGGMVFALSYLRFTATGERFYYLALFSILILMAIIDLYGRWVPDLLQGGVLLLMLSRTPSFYSIIYAFFVLILFLILLALKPGQLGGGDVKVLVILSGLLGPIAFPPLLALASTLGLIYGLSRRFLTPTQELSIPFLPFITLAFIALTLWP